MRRRFKLWNRAHENGQHNSDQLLWWLRTCAQYTSLISWRITKEYPLHNSVNINKYLVCVHDHIWKIVMIDIGCSVIFWSKVSVAKNHLQSFKRAGCWCHSLDLSVALWEQCWFLPPKMHLTFYKGICATFRYCSNKWRVSWCWIKSLWKNIYIIFAFTLHPG